MVHTNLIGLKVTVYYGKQLELSMQHETNRIVLFKMKKIN